jgi:hypothetical protein
MMVPYVASAAKSVDSAYVQASADIRDTLSKALELSIYEGLPHQETESALFSANPNAPT